MDGAELSVETDFQPGASDGVWRLSCVAGGNEGCKAFTVETKTKLFKSTYVLEPENLKWM